MKRKLAVYSTIFELIYLLIRRKFIELKLYVVGGFPKAENRLELSLNRVWLMVFILGIVTMYTWHAGSIIGFSFLLIIFLFSFWGIYQLSVLRKKERRRRARNYRRKRFVTERYRQRLLNMLLLEWTLEELSVIVANYPKEAELVAKLERVVKARHRPSSWWGQYVSLCGSSVLRTLAFEAHCLHYRCSQFKSRLEADDDCVGFFLMRI